MSRTVGAPETGADKLNVLQQFGAQLDLKFERTTREICGEREDLLTIHADPSKRGANRLKCITGNLHFIILLEN